MIDQTLDVESPDTMAGQYQEFLQLLEATNHGQLSALEAEWLEGYERMFG